MAVADPLEKYDRDLDRNGANFVPLSPVSILARTASIFPDRIAVIHGDVRRTWRDVDARCRRLASALIKRGVRRMDTVAVMAPNIPALLECHFAVPAIGAVLNPINVRLDAMSIARLLEHGEARVLLADREYASTIRQAIAGLTRPPLVIDIDDSTDLGERIGAVEYEELLEEGDSTFELQLPQDEWDAFVLSYTSGTTGDPKGVVYHHRGAYLNTMANVAAWSLPPHPVMLWTLPIFHSLGWCFPWTITLMGGTHVCLRKVDAAVIYALIAEHRVTHLCGAPIVLNTLLNAPAQDVIPLDHVVKVMTAASAPPASVIEQFEAQGFEILHVYGLTEVFGPSSICVWNDDWDLLPPARRAALKARQGVAYPSVSRLEVHDLKTHEPVPADGATIGEVVMRSNTVMRGYLKNPQATAAAFAGDWFHSGDLAVMHANGYLELKDRSKDIIISGGENISTIEVESVLYRHPAVLEAAVVAQPDTKWGETPCAFVCLKPGADATAEELIAHCRANLTHFMCPRTIVLGTLPKTSTGKIQKFLLREEARKRGRDDA